MKQNTLLKPFMLVLAAVIPVIVVAAALLFAQLISKLGIL
jgi:preprotein translocase subunit SecY